MRIDNDYDCVVDSLILLPFINYKHSRLKKVSRNTTKALNPIPIPYKAVLFLPYLKPTSVTVM